MRVCVLLLLCAPAALAGPAAVFWRTEAEALAASGSFAPPAVLGKPRADVATSLAAADRAATHLQLRREAPLSLRRGRRERGTIDAVEREFRAVVPLGDWAVGWRTVGGTTRVYHRLRRDDTRVRARMGDSTLGAAWSDGPWTVGLAASDLNVTVEATGATIADLQGLRPGEEGIHGTLGGKLGAIGVEHDAGDWMAGVQLSGRDTTLRLPVEVQDYELFGIFAAEERGLDAWLVAERGADRWFAYLSDRSLAPEGGAIMRGPAIRGRASSSADSTVIGVGRRRETRAFTDHLELSHHRDGFALSGLADRGALGGGITGQYSASMALAADSTALRWSRRFGSGRWRWTAGLSAIRSRFDFDGRYVDLPAPLLPPAHRWEQRLRGGEAWLGSVTIGTGWEAADWSADATLTVLGGDLSAQFEDLTTPAPPPDRPDRSPGPPPPPAPQPSGPGSRLDLGWVLSVSVSAAL